ncbi:MAG: HD domain-containing protein, partial [Gammaproteobacteria bacterium]
QTLGAELPGLTVHDITHLDALWRVADQIAGPDYSINPAEAFVLGSAFLLHDAAHVMAAYPGGISSIKQTVQWQDLIAQRYGGQDPDAHSDVERSALFQVLRHLHAEQAHKLARLEWTVPNAGPKLHLLEHLELREYYADLIGEIAASHHWPAHRVAEVFHDRRVSAAALLQPVDWEVDALKVAFLLRAADAAHIDGLRAPWFLFALRRPEGISEDHWRFQAKLG